jgi:hypothetical protein
VTKSDTVSVVLVHVRFPKRRLRVELLGEPGANKTALLEYLARRLWPAPGWFLVGLPAAVGRSHAIEETLWRCIGALPAKSPQGLLLHHPRATSHFDGFGRALPVGLWE